MHPTFYYWLSLRIADCAVRSLHTAQLILCTICTITTADANFTADQYPISIKASLRSTIRSTYMQVRHIVSVGFAQDQRSPQSSLEFSVSVPRYRTFAVQPYTHPHVYRGYLE